MDAATWLKDKNFPIISKKNFQSGYLEPNPTTPSPFFVPRLNRLCVPLSGTFCHSSVMRYYVIPTFTQSGIFSSAYDLIKFLSILTMEVSIQSYQRQTERQNKVLRKYLGSLTLLVNPPRVTIDASRQRYKVSCWVLMCCYDQTAFLVTRFSQTKSSVTYTRSLRFLLNCICLEFTMFN